MNSILQFVHKNLTTSHAIFNAGLRCENPASRVLNYVMPIIFRYFSFLTAPDWFSNFILKDLYKTGNFGTGQTTEKQ
jgi:hypothetical protein